MASHQFPRPTTSMAELDSAANATKILRLLWAYAVRQTTSSLLPPLHFRAVDPSASARNSGSESAVHEFISLAEAEALVRAAQREFAKEPTLVEIGLSALEQPRRRVIGATKNLTHITPEFRRRRIHLSPRHAIFCILLTFFLRFLPQ